MRNDSKNYKESDDNHNRIDLKFKDLKMRNRKALITFAMAGDPDIGASGRIISALADSGSDVIEIGLPFSDPVAEGSVIQASSERALRSGARIKDVMALVLTLRKSIELPFVFLVYFNCIYQYGIGRFCRDCRICGVDGLIIPDLPIDERGEIDGIADEYGIRIITIVTPFTSEDRMQRMSASAKGFVYCVSSPGVTGVRSDFGTDFDTFFATIDRHFNIPKALGFGISDTEQVKRLREYCDGLIIGSALTRRIGNAVACLDHDSHHMSAMDKIVAEISELTSSFRASMDLQQEQLL